MTSWTVVWTVFSITAAVLARASVNVFMLIDIFVGDPMRDVRRKQVVDSESNRDPRRKTMNEG